MKVQTIKDVEVNLDHESIKSCKTLADVTATGLFSHLSKEESTEAAKQLLSIVKVKDGRPVSDPDKQPEGV
jgi:hypothetical protein